MICYIVRVYRNKYYKYKSILYNTSIDRILDFLKRFDSHEKILSLKNGYNSLVDDSNLNLSGGEKQVLCIARALLKPYDILILDEINSASDKSMEDNIIKNIQKYYINKIVFIISHSNKILEDCKFTINLNNFKI